jgi:hypothetical protein
MNTPRYKEPPLVKICLGHALGTAVLGALLPSGEHLGWLHRLMLPVVELIPNAVRLTERAPDVVFVQSFIGLSLLTSWVILLFCIGAMRGYHTRLFESTAKRVTALIYGWAFVGCCIGIAWFMPYLDPLAHGRTYFMLKAAVSSTVGVLVVMNMLLVWAPLFLMLGLWMGHTCTSVRYRTGYI